MMYTEAFRQVDLLEGYKNQWDLLCDLFTWLDLRLYFFYAHNQWIGPSSDMKNMLGLVVSREEFEHQMAKSAQIGLEEELTPDEAAQLADIQNDISWKLAHTQNVDFPLFALFKRCKLDYFEQNCVLLAYAAVLDRKYEKLLAYLQDDMTRKSPGTALATQLFLPKGENMEQYITRFNRKNFKALFDPDTLAQTSLVLRPMVLEFLSSSVIEDTPWLTFFDGEKKEPDAPLIVQKDIAHQLDLIAKSDTPLVICLRGGKGSGKRFQVKHMLSRKKDCCVFADLTGTDWREKAEQASLEARLLDAHLCLYHIDGQNEAGDTIPLAREAANTLCSLANDRKHLFLLSELSVPMDSERLFADIEIPPLTEDERVQVFNTLLGGRASLATAEELASKFHFSPKQIYMACRQACGSADREGEREPTVEQLHSACYRQVVHKLGELAHRVPAAYSWEDVVLPTAQKRLLKQACGHIRYRHRVYYQWGFETKVSYGKGLSILFAGAPGTGKTMCAQIIARQLNMEMYKINISQVVSKYIGETEKNLRAVFTEARNVGCILFFDECDALFGKRSEVKDAHDRNANVETAYLLQKMEEFDGVCILATNLIGNMDEAFMRRITYVVHFPFPDAGMREAIYRRMIPADAPLADDIDWPFLAEKFKLSGGHIKNIVLAAAFMAAAEEEPIRMRHLLRAAVGEQKKNGILVVREDLREYADLLAGWE